MKNPQPSPNPVDALLAQDSMLNSSQFSETRKKLLSRLEAARQQEKRGRSITLRVSLGCFLAMLTIFGIASQNADRMESWPKSAVTAMAMVILLGFASSALFASVYLFRHRRELRRARNAAQQQTLNEMPDELKNLRREIEILRAQLKEVKDETQPGA